jgi:hypothetical protein
MEIYRKQYHDVFDSEYSAFLGITDKNENESRMYNNTKNITYYSRKL